MLRKIAKASALVSSAAAITLLCSVVAFGFNARSLGVDALGQLALVQAVVSFIGGLTTFDNWQPIVRFGIRSSDRLGLVIGSGVTLDVLASVAAAAIAAVAMCGFADLLGLEQLIGWALVPYWVSLLTGLSGTPKGYFRLTGRFDLLTYNQVFNSALQLAASAVLWYLQAPLEMYLVVLGVTSCFSGITLLGVMLLALRRNGLQLISPFRTHSTRRYFRTFLKVAFGNGVLSSLTTSRYQLVLFIMPGDAGAAATGLFAAASRCASAITRCLVPFSQVVFPEVLRLGSRANSLEVQHAMKRVTIATGLCALLLTAAGVIWSRSLVDLACGSEFSSAASTLSLLIAAEALRWAGFHLSAFVVATKGQAPLLKANALISSITVLAALVSIGPLEEVGGGLAVLLGSACSYVSLMHIARSPRARKMPAGGKVRG